MTLITQEPQRRRAALLRGARVRPAGRDRIVHAAGVVVLAVLLIAACDAPDPELHQFVALDWGSPVRPTYCDLAYGSDRGCPSGSDESCGGSQELDIYRVRAGGNRGTLPTVDAWVAIAAPLDWDSFSDGPRWATVWMGDGYATDRYRSNPVTHLDPSDPPGYVIAGVNDGIVPVENVQAFHRHARSMGLDGYLRVTVDIVDHLADGRPIAPSVIGQPDPRNHCPIGGMNAALFDLWLDDR